MLEALVVCSVRKSLRTKLEGAMKPLVGLANNNEVRKEMHSIGLIYVWTMKKEKGFSTLGIIHTPISAKHYKSVLTLKCLLQFFRWKSRMSTDGFVKQE